ncbi:hypothetical protein AnigIFM59636_002474 [Aspergillus niger]|nr:hypothetical protein AnigIFM59636_002474 [Aspergillus niger]
MYRVMKIHSTKSSDRFRGTGSDVVLHASAQYLRYEEKAIRGEEPHRLRPEARRGDFQWDFTISVQNRVAQMVLAVDIRPVRNEQRARFPRLISSYISGQHGAEVLAPGYPAGSQRSSRVEYQCN